MLVLQRKKGEGIVVGGPCRVIVQHIRENAVRLAFEADRNVAIHRDEVYARIQKKESGHDR